MLHRTSKILTTRRYGSRLVEYLVDLEELQAKPTEQVDVQIPF